MDTQNVGFNTECSYDRVKYLRGGREPDLSTARPVCACLAYEDGRELRFSDNWSALAEILGDRRYRFVVHGVQDELLFCRIAGVALPVSYIDTLLLCVLAGHMTDSLSLSGYRHSSLSDLAARLNVPVWCSDGNEAIRTSIMKGNHVEEYGMNAVLDHCMADARACLKLATPLEKVCRHHGGEPFARNLEELYQPYALLLAQTAYKGIRFDLKGWRRLVKSAPSYRGRLLAMMAAEGYACDGPGLDERSLGTMVRNLGLHLRWPRTRTGAPDYSEKALRNAKHMHPALQAVHHLIQFDALMDQNIGGRVDDDGRIRCGMLPYAQKTGRCSTVRPNLTGLRGELRPLLLPEPGCVFVHFDFSQQEPGIAGYLSQDAAFLEDFESGDVYENMGRRMGLIHAEMDPDEILAVRNGILKALALSILYGKTAHGISKDLGCTVSEANAHLWEIEQTYPKLFEWMRAYVVKSLRQCWAENIVGFRAAFESHGAEDQGRIERSCRNFPIQSSAAACFQVTGLNLANAGADIRLPLHDAYLLNVPDNAESIGQAKRVIHDSTQAAVDQLFPGLKNKLKIEVLRRFAKDGREESFATLIESLRREEQNGS